MTPGQPASRNRSTMRLAPLLSRTAPVSSEIGQLPVVCRPWVVLGNPEAARPVPVGAQVSEDSVVLVATGGGGLERGPVRPADDHLPGIGDHQRRTVCSVEHEDRVPEHQVLDEAGRRRGPAQGGWQALVVRACGNG